MKLLTGGMLYGGTTGGPRRPRRSRSTADSTVVSDAARFRATAANPGEARIELEVTDGCLDATGAVRRGIVLKLIEAAASAAVSNLSDAPLRLLSLSTAFPHAAEGGSLAAVARAHASGRAVHASVEVHENDSARAIATAQAVYAIETERT